VLTAYFDAMSDPAPFVPPSLDDWQRRVTELRPALARVLGLDPLPDRPPLDVRVTGELDEGDYTITRLHWQSWENFYASGWLYRPRHLDAPAPAVLNPHGHWEHGARNPVVQSRLVALARLGYIALAVDSVHVTDFPVGLSSMTAMTWNNIRALDLLRSMPDVDPARIGCTGASGGGQQTMYVAALDDRIAATVNVCLVSHFKKILFADERTHCICNHVPGLLALTDEPEICSLIAPRPSLYLCVTGDWTKDFPAEEFPEIARVYDLHGARDHVDVQQWDWHHDYHQSMREWMYTWFDRHLRGGHATEGVAEPPLRLRAADELAALSAPVPGARPWDELPAHYRAQHAGAHGPLDREALARLLGKDRRRPAVPAEVFGRRDAASRVLRGKSGMPIPTTFLPTARAPRQRIAIVLHPDGRQGADTTAAQDAATRGWLVVLPDVRLRGELGIRWERNATVWGRPEVGMAADDVRAVVDACATPVNGKEPADIVCVGIGEMGVAALAAAALDTRITRVLCPDLGPTFAQGRRESPIPNLLRHGDLPQLIALVLPRPALVGVSEAARADYERGQLPADTLRPVPSSWMQWLD
jgi:dienelactone hydrolase